MNNVAAASSSAVLLTAWSANQESISPSPASQRCSHCRSQAIQPEPYFCTQYYKNSRIVTLFCQFSNLSQPSGFFFVLHLFSEFCHLLLLVTLTMFQKPNSKVGKTSFVLGGIEGYQRRVRPDCFVIYVCMNGQTTSAPHKSSVLLVSGRPVMRCCSIDGSLKALSSRKEATQSKRPPLQFRKRK